MQTGFEPLCNSARLWANTAAGEGWLSADDLRGLAELEPRSPSSLFEASAHRPLVAAFFGGTGVGKSTLLNRLAGQDIARTGVERPTSREVSLYLHESVQIKNLPEGFPLDRVCVARHGDERRRQVLWIDMPDIDSVEQHNRELVLEWLPHIDVLIYVVSPERYRDDKGWRLLHRYGGEHAWIFVLNQWDRAHPSQYDDFVRLLDRAGFHDPLLLCTACRGPRAEDDDFGEFQEWLDTLADRHVLRQLEERAESLRREQLRAGLDICLQALGDETGYTALEEEWTNLWTSTRAELLKGMEWPLQNLARAFIGHDANILNRPIDLGRSCAEPGKTASPLWDDWVRDRWHDVLERLVVRAGERGLPAFPLKVALLDGGIEPAVAEDGQRSLRWALANPGNAVQRFFLRLSGTLTVLLPLVAIGVVSYHVLKGYYESALNHVNYLGLDFAIHSSLLIGLSWLLPWFLYRNIKPSAEAVAVKGLRRGIGLALDRAGEEVLANLRRLEQQRQSKLEEGRRLAYMTSVTPSTTVPQGVLERVIPSARPMSGRC